MNFQALLKKENWESVYTDTDTDPNHTFNLSLCSFLNNVHTSFPVQYKSMKDKNDWITQGIKISFKHDRSLYNFTNNSNDPKANVRYIEYCDILRNVLNRAKKQNYSRLIAKSNKKIRTTWNIINKETGKVHLVEQVPTLLVNDEKLKDPTDVANAFNNFLITITEKLNIQQIIQ